MNHICSDSCFTSRTAKKTRMDCFACSKPSNMSCFSIIDNSVLKLLSSSSNLVFLCGKCSDKVKQMRQKSMRLSSDISTSRSPAPSNVRTPELNQNSNHKNEAQKHILQLLTPLFDSINGKLTKIENDLNETNTKANTHTAQVGNTTITNNTNNPIDNELYKNLNDNITNLHAKIDSRLPSNFNKALLDQKSEFTAKLDLLANKLEILKPNGAQLIAGNTKVLSTPIGKLSKSNPLDWSMNFNQSHCISQHDNVDLYPLLAGFERNTWASLDHLKEKIIENNDLIQSIKSTFNYDTQPKLTISSASNSDSALVNAIHSDVVHDIYKKCENIEHKIDTLVENCCSNEGCKLMAENPSVMSKRIKEAMIPKNSKNVPETLKNQAQKRLSPNLSDCRLTYQHANTIDTNKNLNLNLNDYDGWISDRRVEELALDALETLDTIDGGNMLNPTTHNAHTGVIVDVDASFASGRRSTAQNDNSFIHTSLPQSELANCFLNDVADSELNVNIFHPAPVPSSISSLRENNTETTCSSINKSNRLAKNEFHISKFKPETSCEMIKDYIQNRGVPESLLNDIKVMLLVPKGRDISTLSFVSFKIDVSNEIANVITRVNFWPPACIIKNFIHKPKPIIELQPNNSMNVNTTTDSNVNFPRDTSLMGNV